MRHLLLFCRLCGWTADEHQRFLLTLSQYSHSIPNHRELCMDMLQRLFPRRTRRELVSESGITQRHHMYTTIENIGLFIFNRCCRWDVFLSIPTDNNNLLFFFLMMTYFLNINNCKIIILNSVQSMWLISHVHMISAFRTCQLWRTGCLSCCQQRLSSLLCWGTKRNTPIITSRQSVSARAKY